MVALTEVLDALPNLVGILLKLLIGNFFRWVRWLAPPIRGRCIIDDIYFEVIIVVFNLDDYFSLTRLLHRFRRRRLDFNLYLVVIIARELKFHFLKRHILPLCVLDAAGVGDHRFDRVIIH